MKHIPPSGPSPARILIVGEAPGVTEEKEGAPFVGESGKELTKMLTEAGIDRNECFITNLCSYRPPNNDIRHFFYSNKEAKERKIKPLDGLFPSETIIAGLKRLKLEIEAVNPNVIVACGNYSLWALTDHASIGNKEGIKIPTGIGSWRGSETYTKPEFNSRRCIPIYHPATIMRSWEWRPITVHDLRRAAKFVDGKGSNIDSKYHFTIQPSFTEVQEIFLRLFYRLDECKETLPLAIDIETRLGHIACIGIAWSTADALCIPLLAISRAKSYWTEAEEAWIIRKLFLLFTHPNTRSVGQNFAYDMQYIARHWGFIFNLSFDTLLAQHVLLPGTPKTLAYIASLYCEDYSFWKDEGKEWDPKIHDETQFWAYNCKDAVNTLEVSFAQQALLKAWNLEEQNAFLLRLFPITLRMMLRGVLMDKKTRGELSLRLAEEIMERERWFTSVVKDINLQKSKAKPWYSSPQQLQTLFYSYMNLPVQRHRVTKKPTIDDEALTKLATKEPLISPLVDKIKEYRSLRIFLNNFILAPLDKDGRMRCSYNVGGTKTYRFSSSEDAFGFGTNLQNIPSGNE
jgi:uracil-DNA glycosylase